MRGRGSLLTFLDCLGAEVLTGCRSISCAYRFDLQRGQIGPSKSITMITTNMLHMKISGASRTQFIILRFFLVVALFRRFPSSYSRNYSSKRCLAPLLFQDVHLGRHSSLCQSVYAHRTVELLLTVATDCRCAFGRFDATATAAMNEPSPMGRPTSGSWNVKWRQVRAVVAFRGCDNGSESKEPPPGR
jgi:hypothetical protein